MKKILISTALLLCVLMTFALAGCVANDDPWADAVYTESCTIGAGEGEYTVRVTVGENTVDLTVKTDCTTLGDALLESGLASGDVGAYGLYIKTVNGILADYDVNGAYWGIYMDGEASMTGADGITLTEGVTYELRYTK